MAKKKPGPKPGGRVRSAVVNIRSMPEWKTWLTEFAAAQRRDVPDLIDEALVKLARDSKFPAPPRR